MALLEDVVYDFPERAHRLALADWRVLDILQRADAVDALQFDGVDGLVTHVVEVGRGIPNPLDDGTAEAEFYPCALCGWAVDVEHVVLRHYLDGCPRALHRLVDGVVTAVHRRNKRRLTHRDGHYRIVVGVVRRRPPRVNPHEMHHVGAVCEFSLVYHDNFLVLRL